MCDSNEMAELVVDIFSSMFVNRVSDHSTQHQAELNHDK